MSYRVTQCAVSLSRRAQSLAPRIAGTILLSAGTVMFGVSSIQPAHADNGNCPSSEADISSWIQSAGYGGIVDLSCSSPTTISFSPNATGTTGNAGTGTLVVDLAVTLDAADSPAPITLDGNGDTKLIVNDGDDLVVDGLAFTNGSAGANGGAIDNEAGTVEIDKCRFSHDHSSENGGALENDGQVMTVSYSSFSNDTAGVDGGAIDNSATKLELTSSSINSSSAENGGAVSNIGGTVRIHASTLSSNVAAAAGGAIFGDGDRITIVNSTVSSNTVSGGGGGGVLYSLGAPVTVMESTLYGNSADGTTDGGSLFDDYGAQITITASILATNGTAACAQAVVDGGYNLTDDDGLGCGLDDGKGTMVNTNPLLDGLADNGGAVKTMAEEPNSPAIDAVPLSSGDCLADDARGFPRPDQGGSGAESTCDIGAYESGPAFGLSTTVAYGSKPQLNGLDNDSSELTFTGFDSDDAIGDVSGSTARCTSVAGPSSPVGSYSVRSCGGLSLGSSPITFIGGSVVVTPTTLAVAPDNQSTLFGQSLPTFSYKYVGLVNGQSSAVVSGSPACSTITAPPYAPGDYPITCSVAGVSAPNYTVVSGDGTLTVKRAGLTSAYTGPSLIRLSRLVTLSYVVSSAVTHTGVAGLSVQLTLAPRHRGGQSCSAVTNATGLAKCVIHKVAEPGGRRWARVTFAGNADFNATLVDTNVHVGVSRKGGRRTGRPGTVQLRILAGVHGSRTHPRRR